MTSSIVVVSDLHLHPWSAFAQGSGINNTRLQHSLRLLHASLEQAMVDQCPWVFAGDWVHTIGKVQNEVLNALIDVLNTYDCDKWTVWGNHDARSRGGRIELHETVVGALLEAVPSLRLLSDTGEKFAGVWWMTGAGYQPDGAVLPGFQEIGASYLSDIGVYHQTVQGTSNASGYEFPGGLSKKELMKRHGLSIVGDVHQPQVFQDRAERWVPTDNDLVLDIKQASDGVRVILIPGSPEHHNFGDAGVHGFWRVAMQPDITKKWALPVRLEMVPSRSPLFITVDYPEEVEQGGQNYYRVRHPDNEAAEVVVADRPRLDAHEPARVVGQWTTHHPPTGDLEAYQQVGIDLLRSTELRTPTPALLRRVHVHNFLSYEDRSFTFVNGCRLVVGPNGAGKTTLFDAIYWALFGKNTKGLAADDVVRWGAEDDCVVELEIQLAGGPECLMVRRTRGKQNTLEAWIDYGPDDDPIEGASVKDVQEKVLGILGLTEGIFQALSYYSQERVFLFSRATDAERKTILADMLGLSGYNEAAAAARDQAKEITILTDRLDERIGWLERELSDAMAQVVSAHEKQDGWDLDHATKLQRLHDNLRAARAQREEEVAAVEGALAAIELTEDEKWRVDNLPELKAWQADVGRRLAAARARWAAIPGEVERAQTNRGYQADLITAAEAGKCGLCGAPWSESAAMLPTWREHLAGWDRQLHELGETYAGLGATIDSLESERSQMETLVPRLEQFQALLEKRKLLSQTASPNEAAAAQAIRDAEQDINPWGEHIKELDARVIRLGGDLANARAEHGKSTGERAIFDYWARGFGREGVQSLLLDDLARAFNSARTRVFPALTRGVYDVQFHTQATTKKGDVRERSEFVVVKDGVRRPYESSSGGQRTRIDVGVMFTLLLAVCDMLQVPGILGILVLDEVLGWIDDEGAEAFADMLQELTGTIPSIYVISHDQNLRGLIPDTINVELKEGVSHVVD